MEKIKPVGYLKTTKTSKAHIPNLIRRETDTKPGDRIPYVINASSVLLYNPNLSAKELVNSLEVMKQDIMLRVQEGEPSRQPQTVQKEKTPRD